MVKTSVKVTLAKLCRERLGLRAELGVINLILINHHHDVMMQNLSKL